MKLTATLMAILLGSSPQAFADAQVFLNFTNPETYLIPATTQSCRSTLDGLIDRRMPERDIRPFYLSLLNPELRFESPRQDEIADFERIRIRIESVHLQGGSFTCDFDGEELAAVFSSDPKQRWNGQLPANSKLEAGPRCQVLRCGSVSVVDGSGEFKAKGEVTVFAMVRNPKTGISRPVTATVPIQVLNVW
jgi:hypothetical protein